MGALFLKKMETAKRMSEVTQRNMFARIASGDAQTIKKCLDLLVSYDCRLMPKNREELTVALTQLAVEKGEPVLIELAKVHPDKEFILQNLQPETFNNATGSCSCGGSSVKNDTGPAIVSADTTKNVIPTILPGQMDINNLFALSFVGLTVFSGFALLVTKMFNNGK